MAFDVRAFASGRIHPLPGSPLAPLEPARLALAKYAYTTRYVAAQVAREPRGYFLDAAPSAKPQAGDVVLAEVVWIGQHKRLESPASRRATLYAGDEIVVAYGNRYAPDQFEAEVPDDLSETNLVAAGGVVGDALSAKEGLEEATVVQPVGLLHDAHGVLTLAAFAPYTPVTPLDLPSPGSRPGRPTVVAVVGTSMNSGKSTAAACLTHGLTQGGMRVAAGKATGTGAGGDPGMFVDAGAATVLDFTDFGHVSTYRLKHADVVAVFTSLVHRLASSDCDAVVVEIADGAFQLETARLLADPVFTEYVDQVLFTAGEALSAASGVQELRRLGIEVGAVTGLLTSSPLAVREARTALDLPVIETLALAEPEVAACLLPAPRSAS